MSANLKESIETQTTDKMKVCTGNTQAAPITFAAGINKSVGPNPMLSSEKVDAITKSLGMLDAPLLIAELNKLGVGEDIEIYKNEYGFNTHVSIPKSSVSHILTFQFDLSNLSKSDRTFEISIKDDRILINIWKSKYIPKKILLRREFNCYK